MPVVDAIVASAETVRPIPGPFRGASPEELGLVARWLGLGRCPYRPHQPRVRANRLSAPVAGSEWAEQARDAARGIGGGARRADDHIV